MIGIGGRDRGGSILPPSAFPRGAGWALFGITVVGDVARHERAFGPLAAFARNERNDAIGDHATSRNSGSVTPCCSAIILRWARRDAGMPIFRQLWTVEVGASVSRETSLVPPSASMT